MAAVITREAMSPARQMGWWILLVVLYFMAFAIVAEWAARANNSSIQWLQLVSVLGFFWAAYFRSDWRMRLGLLAPCFVIALSSILQGLARL